MVFLHPSIPFLQYYRIIVTVYMEILWNSPNSCGNYCTINAFPFTVSISNTDLGQCGTTYSKCVLTSSAVKTAHELFTSIKIWLSFAERKLSRFVVQFTNQYHRCTRLVHLHSLHNVLCNFRIVNVQSANSDINPTL